MTIDRQVTIAAEAPSTPEIRQLLAERDAYFDALYADEDRNAKPVNVEQENVRFFAVRDAGVLLGCGAIVWRPTYGELKRFYLRPVARGLGLGRLLLQAVESEARRQGCRTLRLETGILQPEAIGLYRSAGFRDIDCFGEYSPDPLSIFMEKTI